MSPPATSTSPEHQGAAASAVPPRAGQPSGEGDLPLPCPSCGYDLRATTAGRCPECGASLDDDIRSGEATIPWQHRRTIGRVRAFIATLNWALFHPSRLAQQAGRRVEYRAARRFQLICCLIGGAALAVGLTSDFWSFQNELIGRPPAFTPARYYTAPTPQWTETAGDLAILATLWLAMPVWLLLGTGVPSYFFHAKSLPRPLQDRGIAISYYAAAPLVLLPIVAPALWWAGRFSSLNEGVGNPAPLLEAIWWGIAGLLALWCVGGTMLLPAYLLVRGQHAGGGRAAALVATTLITWPLLLVVTLVLLPGLVFYVQFLWHLLR